MRNALEANGRSMELDLCFFVLCKLWYGPGLVCSGSALPGSVYLSILELNSELIVVNARWQHAFDKTVSTVLWNTVTSIRTDCRMPG